MTDNCKTSEGYLPLPKGFATVTIRTAQDPEQWGSWCVVPPLVTSVTFKQPSPANPKVEKNTGLFSKCKPLDFVFRNSSIVDAVTRIATFWKKWWLSWRGRSTGCVSRPDWERSRRFWRCSKAATILFILTICMEVPRDSCYTSPSLSEYTPHPSIRDT